MYLVLKIYNKYYILNKNKNLYINNVIFNIGDIIIFNNILLISNKKFFYINKNKKLFVICLIKKKFNKIKIMKLLFKKRKNYKKLKNIKPIKTILNLIYINLYFLKLL